MTAKRAAASAPCPNATNHQPHPTGFVAHSWWADCAKLVATQTQCPGCDRWEIWTPKRTDLRIADPWPPPYECDWGSCDEESVAERHSADAGEWLPVCGEHLGKTEGERR